MIDGFVLQCQGFRLRGEVLEMLQFPVLDNLVRCHWDRIETVIDGQSTSSIRLLQVQGDQ